MILALAAKNAMLNSIALLLDKGVGSKLTIMIGSDPAAIFDLPRPSAQVTPAGVLSFNLPTDVLAIKSGVPTTAILTDPAGVLVANFNMGTDITLDKDSIYTGGYVSLLGLSITI